MCVCGPGGSISAAGKVSDPVEAKSNRMGVVAIRESIETVFGLSPLMPPETPERQGEGVLGVVSRRQ